MAPILNQTIAIDKNKAVAKKREKIERLRRTKLSDIAVDHIIEGIKDTTYLPGQKINPNIVASQLDISIMPVRDAIERLEQQGWIVRYSQKGTYVRKIRISKMRDMVQVRSMIESEAIFRIIENGTEHHFKQLKKIIDANEKAVADRNIENYEKTDTQFHKKLVKLTENKMLIEMHEEILDHLEYIFLIIVLCSEKIKEHDIMDLSKIPVSHKSIYEAIKAKDLGLALELIRKHLEKSVERYNEMIKIRNLDENNFFED